MSVSGVNHITLSCKDLSRSFDFYTSILGLTPLVRWERGAYFLAGDLWFCLSLDLEFQASQGKGHLAFTVDQANFVKLQNKLESVSSVQWTKNTSEGDSCYFLDPDGNQLEIHVGDWRTRIASLKKTPYPGEIEFFISDSEIK